MIVGEMVNNMDTFQKYPDVHPWNPLHQAQTRLHHSSEGDLEEEEEEQEQEQQQQQHKHYY